MDCPWVHKNPYSLPEEEKRSVDWAEFVHVLKHRVRYLLCTVEAFKNYRATERAEGIYDPRPDPDPSNHTFSHGTDQARYLCWFFRRAFGLQGYEG